MDLNFEQQHHRDGILGLLLSDGPIKITALGWDAHAAMTRLADEGHVEMTPGCAFYLLTDAGRAEAERIAA